MIRNKHIEVNRDDRFDVDFRFDGAECFLVAERFKSEDGSLMSIEWHIKCFVGDNYVKTEVQAILDFMSVNYNYAEVQPREMFIGLLGAEDGP